jgi:hypothetical protein
VHDIRQTEAAQTAVCRCIYRACIRATCATVSAYRPCMLQTSVHSGRCYTLGALWLTRAPVSATASRHGVPPVQQRPAAGHAGPSLDLPLRGCMPAVFCIVLLHQYTRPLCTNYPKHACMSARSSMCLRFGSLSGSLFGMCICFHRGVLLCLQDMGPYCCATSSLQLRATSRPAGGSHPV